jgi:hypothetical protein
LPAWAAVLSAPLGIAGGAAIRAAFVPNLPWTPEAFQLRLVLFNAGAIAIVAAVSRRQAPGIPFSRAVAAAAIFANAWYLVMVVLSIGRPQPPDADPEFRLVGFFAGAAMWLADAAFGAVALRDRSVTRAATLALLIGSLLAFLGMGRLGLSNGGLGWLFTPLSLLGIALNGAAWILIGIELLRTERARAGDGGVTGNAREPAA